MKSEIRRAVEEIIQSAFQEQTPADKIESKDAPKDEAKPAQEAPEVGSSQQKKSKVPCS